MSWGNIESVNFSLFLETKEPKLQSKPHILKSISSWYLLHRVQKCCLREPAKKGRGEGRVDSSLKKRTFIPWRLPDLNFASKMGPSWHTPSQGLVQVFLRLLPLCSTPEWSAFWGALFYITGCSAALAPLPCDSNNLQSCNLWNVHPHIYFQTPHGQVMGWTVSL